MPCHLHLTHVINTDKPGHRYIFFEFDFFHLFEGATLKFVLPENIFFKTYYCIKQLQPFFVKYLTRFV